MELPKETVYMMNCASKKSSKCMIQETDAKLGHLGLKFYHVLVLATIGFKPGSSQKNIRENTPFTKARVSIIVSELIDMGYVVNNSKGKAASLHLTEVGMEVFGIAEDIFFNHHRNMLSTLTEEEYEIFQEIILKVNARLDEMLQHYDP